jgi:hypothetical protein
VSWDGSWESADDPAEGDIQDEIPLEWIRMLERERAAEEAAWRARHERMVNLASWLVPAALLGAGLIAVITILAFTHTSSSPAKPQVPAGLPTAVQAFAKTLPASQSPNPAGLTLVDGTDAPSTWRVAWETERAAFCFAFVHAGEPPQTLCGAPGSVTTAQMRIGGELNDTGLSQPELFTCGYTTGPSDEIFYAEVDDGAVVGNTVDMGSGLSAYCLPLPGNTAAGASFTVSTYVVTIHDSYPNDDTSVGVTATYP